MAHVRLEQLGKIYHEPVTNRVLNDVTLSIECGSFVVILGRSGSGKSTLLNLVGALDRASTGQIFINDIDLATLNETGRTRLRRSHVGFVFQAYNLIPTLTVAENVTLPLELNGRRDRKAAERVAELLAAVGLADMGMRYPETLSGGEQQRLAIARALAHDPGLILADEPTGNLDLETAREVLALLESECRRRGKTLIMATHSREVMGRADRVFQLRLGRLEETGP